MTLSQVCWLSTGSGAGVFLLLFAGGRRAEAVFHKITPRLGSGQELHQALRLGRMGALPGDRGGEPSWKQPTGWGWRRQFPYHFIRHFLDLAGVSDLAEAVDLATAASP